MKFTIPKSVILAVADTIAGTEDHLALSRYTRDRLTALTEQLYNYRVKYRGDMVRWFYHDEHEELRVEVDTEKLLMLIDLTHRRRVGIARAINLVSSTVVSVLTLKSLFTQPHDETSANIGEELDEIAKTQPHWRRDCP